MARRANRPAQPQQPRRNRPGQGIQQTVPQWSNEVQQWGRDNRWANTAYPWYQDVMKGDMSNNPWMQSLYNDINGVGGDVQNTFDQIQQMINGLGVAGGTGGGYTAGWGPAGGSGSSYAAGGGMPPDTVGNSNSFFARQVRDAFDPSHLDPANDPTIEPLLRSLRIANQRNTATVLADLDSKAEGAGAFGGGNWLANQLDAQQRSMESLDSASASAMMAARNRQMDTRDNYLQQTNVRDIAAMNDATNRAQIAASEAGNAAAAAAQANAQKLQALQLLLSGQQNVLGLRGDMSNLMQSGQTAAGNIGLGFGNMGISGYNAGIEGMLGLGNYLNNRGQLGIARGQLQLNRDQLAQNGIMNMMNMLMGIGGLGGASYGSTSGQYIQGGGDSTMNGILAALQAMGWGGGK